MMNQYERAEAVEKVEGYDLRINPHKSRQREFSDAKAECLDNLRNRIANVEDLTFEQYMAVRKEKTTTGAK